MTQPQEPTQADWYQAMAAAMRQRDTCLNAIERWKAKLADAEAHIKNLALNGQDANQSTSPAQGNAVDPDWAESAE